MFNFLWKLCKLNKMEVIATQYRSVYNYVGCRFRLPESEVRLPSKFRHIFDSMNELFCSCDLEWSWKKLKLDLVWTKIKNFNSFSPFLQLFHVKVSSVFYIRIISICFSRKICTAILHTSTQIKNQYYKITERKSKEESKNISFSIFKSRIAPAQQDKSRVS